MAAQLRIQGTVILVDEADNGYNSSSATTSSLFKEMSLLDRLLTPMIILCMIVGVIIGVFVPRVRVAFDTVQFDTVSVPIALGLIIMMWPILAQVQYELLPQIFTSRRILIHISFSLLLNWLIGPFVMFGLAWLTLPDLVAYREGVILVGLARCIAMVMIWNQLARGDTNYCAIIVIVNSVLQIVLYAPLSILFINVIGNNHSTTHLTYRSVAISVLIYLGIPLIAGVITRFVGIVLLSRNTFENKIIPILRPIPLVGLSYVVIVIFAYQGRRIIDNIGPVFRVLVPLVLYFIIMWGTGFGLVYWFSLTRSKTELWGYKIAVLHGFTAGSNNFELAIAAAIAIYGVDSDQALAATIGPLAEVPVLLSLTWLALVLEKKLKWCSSREPESMLSKSLSAYP